MRKINLFIVILTLATTYSFGQQYLPSGQNYYDDDLKGIVYNKEFTVDLKLHTHGFALGVNFGTLKTFYRTDFFNFEIGELKHPREVRQNFDFQPIPSGKVSRAFSFGKQNSFFVLRGGFGQKRYFSEKAKRRGLAIGLSYEAGPSLGLVKPYYLELIKLDTDPNDPSTNVNIVSERFSEDNLDEFLDANKIFGYSGFSKGLGEISVMPGGHAKFAVHFDWGAFDEFVKAIEAGVMVDFYFKKIPIMVESDRLNNIENQPYFFNLYLNLQLGKRW